MARRFRSKLRLVVGGTMNQTTGVMTGGITLGHFVASYSASISRQVLSSAISNGPTVREVDPDGDTCDITIEAEQDSVTARNLGNHWVEGGPVGVSSADALDQAILTRYGIFMMGNYGQSGSKESAKESATLVGTNSLYEAAWLAAQNDLDDGGGGG
jgi:hypothetical protein